MVTSIAGAQLFTAGQTTLPLAINDANTRWRMFLIPSGSPITPMAARRGLRPLTPCVTVDLDSNYIAAASHVTDLAMQANAALAGTGDTSVTPVPDSGIARQFSQVARLIKSGQPEHQPSGLLCPDRRIRHAHQPDSWSSTLCSPVQPGMRSVLWTELGAQSLCRTT